VVRVCVIEFKSVMTCKGGKSGTISAPDVLDCTAFGGVFSLSVD
jgi:hypothetical protein